MQTKQQSFFLLSILTEIAEMYKRFIEHNPQQVLPLSPICIQVPLIMVNVSPTFPAGLYMYPLNLLHCPFITSIRANCPATKKH